MISWSATNREKFFEHHNAIVDGQLTDYDTAIAPDVLTSISLNYEARKIIVSALRAYYADSDDQTLDTVFNAMIEDIYD